MKRTLTTILLACFLITGLAVADNMDKPPRWDGKPGRPGMGPRWMDQADDHRPMHRLLMGIDLNEKQEQSLIELQRDHQRKMLELKSENAGLRDKMQLLITDDDYSKSKANSLIEKMTNAHKEHLMARIEHVREVRDVLTEDQKKIFDHNHLMKRGPGKGFRGGRGPHMRGPRCR